VIPIPLTSYCKKCGRDMPRSERCPECGAKLAPGAVRLAWCVEHTPVRDWMSWNAALRIVLPVLGMTLLLTLMAEAAVGGIAGVAAILKGWLLPCLMLMLASILAVLLLILILQGDDLLDCVIDNAGLHVQQYLPNPTPLKLILRFRSPALLETMGEENMLLIASREIPWKEIRRVQLWPEKTMLLLYAPRWWLRLSIPCTPFTWTDALGFVRDKIGKKKDVILPPECIQTAPPKARKAAPKRTQQLSIDDLPSQPIPPEEVPPEWNASEQPSDFIPLEDVLAEIKQSEQS